MMNNIIQESDLNLKKKTICRCGIKTKAGVSFNIIPETERPCRRRHRPQLTIIPVVGGTSSTRRRPLLPYSPARSRCRQEGSYYIIACVLLRVRVRHVYTYGCCEYYINPIKASHTHGRLCRGSRRTRYTN